jgi:excisionase family DNA binding protein
MSAEELAKALGDRLTVTVDEAARLLGVGRSTVYGALERGEIPNAGIGGTKRVPAWWLVQKLSPPKNPAVK